MTGRTASNPRLGRRCRLDKFRPGSSPRVALRGLSAAPHEPGLRPGDPLTLAVGPFSPSPSWGGQGRGADAPVHVLRLATAAGDPAGQGPDLRPAPAAGNVLSDRVKQPARARAHV